MIKVNLISKKSRAYKGRNWTRIIILSLFGLLGTYFVGATLYVVISMYVINTNIKKVNNESTAISDVMLSNNEKLGRFVLTKLILTKIEDIEKQRFHYKDYLDQVSLLIPNGSLLTAVGFTAKGWISLGVKSNNVNDFGQLEKIFVNNSTWKGNKYFSSAYVEGVTKDKTGAYTTRLQLELAKINGGN